MPTKFASCLPSYTQSKLQGLPQGVAPRICEVPNRGSLFYSVDARKTGTNGKQGIFSDLEVAKEHVETLAQEQIRSGSESTAKFYSSSA